MKMACKECSTGVGAGPSGVGGKKTGVGSLPFFVALNGSPVLQYAWALGLPFVPFHANIRAVFLESSSDTLQPVSLERGVNRLNVSSIVDQVSYQIDAPNYNAGAAIKPQIDFYFQRQSGIQSTMIIDGAPRYVVAPEFTPLEGLLSSLQDGWPGGWVLEYTQNVIMQFQQTVPVPSFPTTVTVTFRLWQPGNGQALDLVGMTNDVAQEKLKKLVADGTIVRTNGLNI